MALLPALLLICNTVTAQEKVEMADTMRSNGKIYIVVAVCVTILVGLFIYVMSIDRKIKKMEKEKTDF
ncbi:MAG: CcmD family protein [Bacteroidetes bacterium]|nr:CcmD family protein [Bacteroidota bacterium]